MEEKLQTLCLDLRCGNITQQGIHKELFSIYNEVIARLETSLKQGMTLKFYDFGNDSTTV